MALHTTALGAFPKPAHLELPDWFAVGEPDAADFGLEASTSTQVDRATQEVVRLQVDAGVDIPTDGEIRRENYIHYHCRHLDGFDFGKLTEKVVRDGTWRAKLPTVVGPIAPRESFLDRDYLVAQSATSRPVKMTIPGALTIMDTSANAYYESDLAWGHALAKALNHEVLALVDAGCTQIQIDEPVFARYPDAARSYGFDLIEVALGDVPEGVTTTVHVCCGYPDRLDNLDYPKADPHAYHHLAEHIDASSIDMVSLEDAHRHNDLDLFERFANTIVVLGAVRIASSQIETVDEIASRVEAVLQHVGGARMLLAPDCGLGFLPQEIALAKLRNLREAADRFG
ncbi:MAG: cobalamin-independent methionine synthase II family protein [Acidimicrobiia bacterium]|nr:cobalamin-independent methionine synthase II family protein [Acidimicrobiia bacterium]NNF63364.1 cobalamin-independent methionine synthase II family protein [Acidimicrobiia bacterium]